VTVRRVYCHGNCGRWWYYDAPKGGRPREWCDRCYPIHLDARKRCPDCGFKDWGHKERHPCEIQLAISIDGETLGPKAVA
jgi:hypothetical protein